MRAHRVLRAEDEALSAHLVWQAMCNVQDASYVQDHTRYGAPLFSRRSPPDRGDEPSGSQAEAFAGTRPL